MSLEQVLLVIGAAAAVFGGWFAWHKWKTEQKQAALAEDRKAVQAWLTGAGTPRWLEQVSDLERWAHWHVTFELDYRLDRTLEVDDLVKFAFYTRIPRPVLTNEAAKKQFEVFCESAAYWAQPPFNHERFVAVKDGRKIARVNEERFEWLPRPLYLMEEVQREAKQTQAEWTQLLATIGPLTPG